MSKNTRGLFYLKRGIMNKKYSLKEQHNIIKLLQKKETVGSKYYVAHYVKKDQADLKIAVSVSKKIGNAVERNYEKRVVREIIRKRTEMIQNYDILFVIKTSSTELTFEEKEKQIEYILNKMIKKG